MSSGRARRRGPKGDRGESLLEVMIAVTIIALAVGPLLGTLVEALASSSEGRSFATIDTILKGFAETVTSQIQLAPAGTTFNNCTGTVSYKVLSLPTPQNAAAGAAVTVFGTGFGNGLPVGTFSVTVGGTPATVLQNQSQSVSGTEMGNMQLTFRVPTVPSGARTIIVTDGNGTSIPSTPATDLTVTPKGSTSTSSPVRGYTLGVASVRYWNPGTATESNPLPDCVLNGGLQLLTLHARAANGVSDTLTFALRNPEDVHIPVPTPAVTVSASPVFIARPGAATTPVPLVFTAIVTPASSEPALTGTVHWAITEAGSSVTTCPTPATRATGSDATVVYTCTVIVSSSSNMGRYKATATYPAVTTVNKASSGPGFASVYGPNGSGTVRVSPSTVTKSSTGNTLTFTYTVGTGGMFGGEVTIKVPATGGTPNKKWTPPKASPGAGYTVAKIGTTLVPVRVTTTTANTIVVTTVTLPQHTATTLVVTYGANGGTTGVTAPKSSTTYTFVVKQSSVATTATTLAPVATSPAVVTVVT